MKTLLEVIIDDAGNLGVKSYVPNHVETLGLLEVAKDAVKGMMGSEAKQQSPILLARGVLPNGHK